MLDDFQMRSATLCTDPTDYTNPAKWGLILWHARGGMFPCEFSQGCVYREPLRNARTVVALIAPGRSNVKAIACCYSRKDCEQAIDKHRGCFQKLSVQDADCLANGTRPTAPELRTVLNCLASDASLAEYTLDDFADEFCEGMKVSAALQSYAKCQATLAWFRKCGVDAHKLQEATDA